MRTIRLSVIMICLTAATVQARVKDSGHQLTMVQGGEATNDVQQEFTNYENVTKENVNITIE